MRRKTSGIWHCEQPAWPCTHYQHFLDVTIISIEFELWYFKMTSPVGRRHYFDLAVAHALQALKIQVAGPVRKIACTRHPLDPRRATQHDVALPDFSGEPRRRSGWTVTSHEAKPCRIIVDTQHNSSCTVPREDAKISACPKKYDRYRHPTSLFASSRRLIAPNASRTHVPQPAFTDASCPQKPSVKTIAGGSASLN